jgi:ParB family transcriptional regulator, chromosome partitioning protein
MDVELQQLELRYASLRAQQPARERELLADLAEHGQRQPLVLVGVGVDRYVVIDGYKRVRALERLRHDTACALVWDVNTADALIIERLMRSGESDNAIEQGWLLRELSESHGLSQTMLANRFGKSLSWVSRRLALVESLPLQVTRAVADGKISAYVAEKYLVPLARAKPREVENIVQSIAGKSLTTREVEQLVIGYQGAAPEVRPRLLADPQLYLRAQAAAKEVPSPPAEGTASVGEAVRLALARATAQVSRCQQMLVEHGSRLEEVEQQRTCGMVMGLEQAVAALVAVAESDVKYVRPKHTNSHPQTS